jgi:C1A family cysteine protease
MRVLHKYSAIADAPDSRDHIALGAVPGAPIVSHDLRRWMPPIQNQGNEGCCTAETGTRILSWLVNRFLGKSLLFSPQFLYRAERIVEGDILVDGGAQSRTMMAVLRDTGCCLESSDPFTDTGWQAPTTHKQLAEAQQYRIGAYHRIPELDTLRSVLSSGYPASLAIAVYESFESDAAAKSGIIPMPNTASEQLLGAHEVTVAGMDESSRRLLMANSWGTGWGLDGYFWLPYDYWQYVSDSWLAHLGPKWA